jgi:hypothetical protein
MKQSHLARLSAIKAHRCGSRARTPQSVTRHCRRCRELAPPLASTAGQPSRPPPYTLVKLPWLCVDLHRLEPCWSPRDCGRATAASSPRLIGGFPDRANTTARGELNRPPVPLVALLRPHLATGEPPRRCKGMDVKSRDPFVNQGLNCNESYLSFFTN